MTTFPKTFNKSEKKSLLTIGIDLVIYKLNV